MKIIQELPSDLIAIVLQYHIPDDPNSTLIAVLNGPHRQSIIDAHTIIQTTYNYGFKIIRHLFRGKCHREFNKGPAYELYYKNGNIWHRQWYINGKRHREPNQGPAVETYYETGTLRFLEWYINGKYHRKDGAAYEEYYNNGNIWYREWYINGKYHRKDGPAYEQYYDNGNIMCRSWYINGKQLTEKEFQELSKQ